MQNEELRKARLTVSLEISRECVMFQNGLHLPPQDCSQSRKVDRRREDDDRVQRRGSVVEGEVDNFSTLAFVSAAKYIEQ